MGHVALSLRHRRRGLELQQRALHHERVVAAELFLVDRYQFFFSMWIYGCSLILLAFVMSSFFTEAKTVCTAQGTTA